MKTHHAGYGPAVRSRRQALGLNQYDLAASIGRHPGDLSRWERGLRLMPLEYYMACDEVLISHEHNSN